MTPRSDPVWRMGSSGQRSGAAVLSPIVGGFGPSAVRLERADSVTEVVYEITVPAASRLVAVGLDVTDNARGPTEVIATLMSIAGDELVELRSDGSGRRQRLERHGLELGPGTYYLGAIATRAEPVDVHRWMHQLLLPAEDGIAPPAGDISRTAR